MNHKSLDALRSDVQQSLATSAKGDGEDPNDAKGSGDEEDDNSAP